MAELTPEEAKTLEAAVMDKLCSGLADDAYSKLEKLLYEVSVKAAVATLQEYSKMKVSL